MQNKKPFQTIQLQIEEDKFIFQRENCFSVTFALHDLILLILSDYSIYRHGKLEFYSELLGRFAIVLPKSFNMILIISLKAPAASTFLVKMVK